MAKALLDLSPGSAVICAGKEYTILRHLDLDRVLARARLTGNIEQLRVEQIAAPKVENGSEGASEDLCLVDDEDWRLAEERFELIRPIIKKGARCVSLEEKKAKAKIAGVHVSTLYRWIERYEETGKISSLLDGERTGGRGKGRLDEKTEAVMQAAINEKYLTKQRLSVKKVHQELQSRCEAAGLECPHVNTVRHRVNVLSERQKLKARVGEKQASEGYDPRVGHFPDADWPLAVVQIDHSLLDIILLDEIDRLPVGRPWITLCIDVYSRLVMGFYLSLDPPGSISVGQCLIHAILPKENWLARLDIATEWPCWGIMDTVHADNAREFRGNMLRRATQEYGIDLQWRKVKTPHYGGHIERLMGTVAGEIHALPGTTFSGPHKRLDYDSVGKATMTLAELERWLTNFFVGVYHQREHGTLRMSPLQKFREGILGDGRRPGRGMPRKVTDEERLRMDLLPFVERTVQAYGVLAEGIHYYDEVLRPFIKMDEPGAKTTTHRKFLFRYDPRDVSVIYFFHPDLKVYRAIPYRDTWRPTISIWELRAAQRILQGRKDINENLIFETIDAMRDIEVKAGKLTMKVRRLRQRRLIHRNLDVHGLGGAPALPAGPPPPLALPAPAAPAQVPVKMTSPATGPVKGDEVVTDNNPTVLPAAPRRRVAVVAYETEDL